MKLFSTAARTTFSVSELITLATGYYMRGRGLLAFSYFIMNFFYEEHEIFPKLVVVLLWFSKD